MESLKTLISNVLDNSESLCLDSAEDKQTLLDSIMDALALDDLTVIQTIEQSGDGEDQQMKALISFSFLTDAKNHLEKYKLNAFINKNKRTGKYDVVQTYVDALKGKVVEWED